MVISYLQAAQFQPGMLVNVKYNPSNAGQIAIESVTGVTASSMGAQNVEQLQESVVNQDKFYQAIRSMGEAAEATILSADPMGVMINGENPLMKFRLEVHPANRPSFTAETQGAISQASREKYETGKTVWVKFNPNDTSQVALDHS